MATLALLNNKGGVGKTTTTFNLGAALAKLGYKTALIDLDPQANLTSRFSDNVIQEGKDWLSLVKRNEPLTPSDFSYTEYNNLFLIPNLKNFNDEIFNFKADFDQYFVISEMLNYVKDLFDFIIFDTTPLIGKISQNAMIAADFLILPIRFDMDSVDGVEATLMYYDALRRRQNIKAQILGILPTHVRQVEMNNFTLDNLKERGINIPVFENQIPLAVAFDESRVAKQPVFVYDNTKTHYIKLGEEVLNLCQNYKN